MVKLKVAYQRLKRFEEIFFTDYCDMCSLIYDTANVTQCDYCESKIGCLDCGEQCTCPVCSATVCRQCKSKVECSQTCLLAQFDALLLYLKVVKISVPLDVKRIIFNKLKF